MKLQDPLNQITTRINKVKSLPGFFQKGAPFFYKGNDTAVLVLPGFDDSPYLMKEYSDCFIKAGYTVYSICLPGRGQTVKEFASFTWEEWVTYAEEDFNLLCKLYKKVVIVGFSTGATVGLHIISKTKNTSLKGVILLSPAIFFVSHLIPLSLQIFLLEIYKLFNPFPKKLNNGYKIYIDPLARKKYETIKLSSIKAIIELMKCAKQLRKILRKINLPVLIIQSDKDIVVAPFGAKWLLKRISQNTKLIRLKKSGHPVMVDLEKEKVFKHSLKFLKDLD